MSNVIELPKTVTPPAGFKLQHYCSCGLGCTPDELNVEDNCEILGFSYEGPSVALRNHPGVQLNSYWSAEEGVHFRFTSYGYKSEEEYVEMPLTTEQMMDAKYLFMSMTEKIEALSKEAGNAR